MLDFVYTYCKLLYDNNTMKSKCGKQIEENVLYEICYFLNLYKTQKHQ